MEFGNLTNLDVA
nr:RecName: Full=23 kDa structural polyprotein [Shrimp white spot syndrome virus]